jgi:hypothetical protein
MKPVLRLLGVSLLVCNFSQAQEKTTASPKPQAAAAASEARNDAAESAEKLPVRRVVLYENGVGYFEHLGRVRGSQDVHIDFTSAQLNDVLKSLTVLDLAGGRITGVDYNSEAPLARRLATLRLALGEKPSVSEFLAALRGARLEVRGGTGPALTGKLLSVERKTRNAANWTVETDEISLITDAGEVRSVDLNPTTNVRIVDHDLNVEIGKYLSLIASAREQDVRRMTISTAGTGERNLYVSYISEVPIWKTTYRIVLPTKAEKKPLLQGWAIVDNTVGEDWNDVELSLVAGAPHSFIQELSEPYYGRRPVVPLPESVQLSPQTHAATLVPQAQTFSAGVSGGVAGGIAGGSMGGVIGGVSGGTGRNTALAAPQTIGVASETVEVESAMEGSEPAAEGAALGDMFEYKLKERVTIRKNQSALVPILQTDILADKVSLWNETLGMVHPLRALWLNNASTLTLKGGSFSVLDENTFAGEGLLEAIRPGERRLLSYATDLGLVVDSKMESEQERVTHAFLRHGLLTTQSELREKKTYIVRNEDTVARALVIEHPARQEYTLAADAPKPEEKAAELYRFRLNVPPKETARLVVNEAKPLYTEYALRDVTDDQIALYLRQKWINPDIEKALRRIVEQKNVVADFNAQLQSGKQSIDQIFTDQGRLRENMKALKGSAEEKALLQRYTKQLDEEETQLDALRKKMKDTEAQRDKANAELAKMIADLEMDAAL